MIENVSARQKEWRIFFMKKWKLGALLLTAALLAAGCSKAEKQETAPEPEQPDYYVGVEADNAPYYSTDENGTVSGFYVDLMNTLSERGGFTYEFKTMSPAEYKAAGADPTDENNGTSSQPGHLFLGTMEPEAGDTSTYARSEPVYETGLCLLVKKGQGIRKMKNLRSVSIAARAETEEAVFADDLAASYDAETIVFQDAANVISDVSQGYSGAMVLDQGKASLVLQQDGTLKLMTTSEKYFSVHRFTAAATEEIPETFSSALEEIRADGTLNALLQQYGLGA